ncbi:hypothetical protein ACFVBP_28415 [Nocardioides sp. NPDC057764]|uniref:hypothetical protein n=1 Tax=Nocardioides sp. NPDC057764 TaxID=3346243 RepID=UPI00366E66B9
MSNPHEKLAAILDAQTTPQLLALCVEMDNNLDEHGQHHKDSDAWSLLATYAADTITERHPEVLAQIEIWAGDESDEGATFFADRTYTDLLLLACDFAGVAPEVATG